jgi:hypothetical protein
VFRAVLLSDQVVGSKHLSLLQTPLLWEPPDTRSALFLFVGFFFFDLVVKIFRTRVVQKVIDTMNTPDQVSMLVSALNTGMMCLMTDSYGNHVVDHCLQKLLPEHKAVSCYIHMV